MPSSTYWIISNAVDEIMRTNPNSILDIGIGFGKWGLLCREYLECWRDRVYPDTWKVRIVGIEIWKPYVEKLVWNKVLYDKIYVGDAFEMIDNINENFDLIIANDVIEHMEKEKGLILLDKLVNKFNKKMLVNIPIGEMWLNNVVTGDNPYEKHKSVWDILDLIDFARSYSLKWKRYIWNSYGKPGVLMVYEK